MHHNDTAAAKKSRYHFGYVGALEDAGYMSGDEIGDAIVKAERFGQINREKGKIDAAHLYEGKAKGYRDALRGMYAI